MPRVTTVLDDTPARRFVIIINRVRITRSYEWTRCPKRRFGETVNLIIVNRVRVPRIGTNEYTERARFVVTRTREETPISGPGDFVDPARNVHGYDGRGAFGAFPSVAFVIRVLFRSFAATLHGFTVLVENRALGRFEFKEKREKKIVENQRRTERITLYARDCRACGRSGGFFSVTNRNFARATYLRAT